MGAETAPLQKAIILFVHYINITKALAGASGNRTQPGPSEPTAALKAEAPTRDTAAPVLN